MGDEAVASGVGDGDTGSCAGVVLDVRVCVTSPDVSASVCGRDSVAVVVLLLCGCETGSAVG